MRSWLSLIASSHLLAISGSVYPSTRLPRNSPKTPNNGGGNEGGTDNNGGKGGDDGLGGGGFCSFTPDTLVATNHGEVAIGDLKVGDHVLAYNQQTGETGSYAVDAVLVHTDAITEDLTIDAEVLHTTPEHPFFTLEQGWTAAGKLKPGEHVRKADGRFGTVDAIRLLMRPQRMYNLTVHTAHTFFVGVRQWLVHNKCGDVTIDSPKQDWAEKGAHIKVDIGGKKPVELSMRPDNTGNGVVFRRFFSNNTDAEIALAMRYANEAITNNRFFVQKAYSEVSKGVRFVLQFPNDGGIGRSLELNFLKIALGRILGLNEK